MLSTIVSVGGCCMKVAVGVILVLALVAVKDLGEQWKIEVDDVDIYTIQDPRFWGPMTMLVPRNCTKLQEMMHARGSTKASFLENAAQMGKPPSKVQTSLLGYVKLPDVDILHLTAVHRCGQTIDAPKVTWSQYYWSAMITASSNFDINEMHKSRMRMYWLYVLIAGFGLLSEVLTSSLNTAKSITTEIGFTDAPESDGTPCILKASGFIAKQLLSKVGTLIQQLGFVSLFVTFWHEDHYLMNYFPGRAMVMMFFFVNFPTIIIGIRTSIGEAIGESQQDLLQDPVVKALGVCSTCCSCLCCLPVILPMAGWGFYNYQFLYVLFKGEYQNEVAFSASFPSMEKTLGDAAQRLIGINIVDVVMATLADLAPGLAALAREPTSTMSDPNEPLLVE